MPDAAYGAAGVEETVEAVVQFALQALNCSYAGLVLYTKGARPETVAVTDPVVAEAYDLQIDDEDGPLVMSLRNRQTVLIRDARGPGRAAQQRLGAAQRRTYARSMQQRYECR